MDTTRYQLLLDLVTAGHWDLDLGSGRAYLSPGYCDLIGYSTADTVFDIPFLEKLIHPDDRDRVLGVIEEQVRGERETSVVEYRVIARDGSLRWIESRGTVAGYDELGRPAKLAGTVVDIGDRKQAELCLLGCEDALLRSHDLLNEFSRQVPGTLFQAMIFPDGHISVPYASEKLQEIYELAPGNTPVDVEAISGRFHPDDRDRVLAGIFEVADKLIQWECEYRVILPRQGLRWLYGVGSPQRLGDGTVVVYGIIMDITERKRIEERLRLSEEKFCTAFRVSPDSINLNRLADGVYLEVNEGFTALTGYRSEEVLGRSSLELNIWADPADRNRLVRQLAEQGVVNNFEALFRCKDGSTPTGIMSARVIDIEGEPCILSIARDITERKLAEEYLRESEHNLRVLMDSMPAAVWWFDTDGNIEYLNRCFVEQLRYTLDDIPTLDDWFVRAYPDPEYREPYLAARDSAIAEARRSRSAVPPREAKITCRDGIRRHFIINTQFALGHTVEIFTDITARELFHHQLQKVEKLESLGVLAGGIAHDFNNILTGILGNISFARTFLAPSHKSSDLLRNAEKAASRAAELAHQLLTFAKGGQPIKQDVSVRQMLEESTGFVLRGSNVSSEIEIPDEFPSIKVDEGQFSQVINNLVINASQAMPGGGKISIRGEAFRIDADDALSRRAGNYVRLTFSDTGCGISREDQDRIFDPYFSTKAGGNGLGLASAHSVIAKHGGYIGVTSAPGKGSCFELLLPASTREATGGSSGAAPTARVVRAGISVLVMDDEEMIRNLACAMIGSLGYRADSCPDGTSAIDLYRAAHCAGAPYSVVIMDLTIPGGMGGQQAAQRIMEIDPDARLIVSSGYSTDPIMADFARFGFCATLLKPYSIREMTGKLTTVLAAGQIGEGQQFASNITREGPM